MLLEARIRNTGQLVRDPGVDFGQVGSPLVAMRADLQVAIRAELWRGGKAFRTSPLGRR